MNSLVHKVETILSSERSIESAGLAISYGFAESPFGPVAIAQAQRGICALEFISLQQADDFLERLQNRWPNAERKRDDQLVGTLAQAIFVNEQSQQLLLQGTLFQLKVWQALLKLKDVSTYQQVAQSIAAPQAIRAVAKAVGSNTVGYLVPCHLILRANDDLGGFRWGLQVKQAILAAQQQIKKIA